MCVAEYPVLLFMFIVKGYFVGAGFMTQIDSTITNNSALASVFELTSGDCPALGGCFTSPNFPLDYPIPGSCTFKSTHNSTLAVNSFSTAP